MSEQDYRTRWLMQAAFGLVAGAAIAAVDNVFFGGEVSPVAIVVLLLATAVTAAVVWGSRCWLAALVIWASVPAPHLVKQILHLPDTLHPNTYKSVLMLAAFSFVVTIIGTAFGLLGHRLVANRAAP